MGASCSLMCTTTVAIPAEFDGAVVTAQAATAMAEVRLLTGFTSCAVDALGFITHLVAAGGGPRKSRHAIVGTPLQAHFYPDLCKHLVQQKPLQLCCFWWFPADAPTTKAAAVLLVGEPRPAGGLRLHMYAPTDLHRAAAQHLSLAAEHAVHVQCAACQRFQCGDKWFAPEVYYHLLLDLQGRLRVLNVSHSHCPSCVRNAGDGQSDADARSQGLPSPRQRRPRVLVVDDDPVCGRLVCRIAEKAGTEVLLCSSACEALDVLLRQAVDVVITDIVMPGATGLDLCAAARKQGLSNVRFIGMSGFEEYRAPCLAGGMDAFLTKPVSRGPLEWSLELVRRASVATLA